VKKYTKVASFFLFAALAVFILFQYQNCGGNNNNNNWSAVGPSGVSYMVTMTPPATATHGNNPVQVIVRVQTSGPESLIVRIGTIVNGNKNEICSIPTSGPVTDTQNLYCWPTFPQAGVQTLYVDVGDPNFPSNTALLSCTNPPIQGCIGTYTITVN
jgi:hypothetical protein